MYEIGTKIAHPKDWEFGPFSQSEEVLVMGYVYYESTLFHICVDPETGRQKDCGPRAMMLMGMPC